MNMVPSSVGHPSTGSLVQPPPLPRPPTAPSGSGPMQGHPGHQGMGGPYGHPPPHQQQSQSHGMGPGGPAYPPMPSQSPSPRGVPPTMLPNGAPAPSPYHNLHSPPNNRQPPPPMHHQGMPPHPHRLPPPQGMHPQPPQSHHQVLPPHAVHHPQQPRNQYYRHPPSHPPQAMPPHQPPPSHQPPSNMPQPRAPSTSSNQSMPPSTASFASRDWQSDKDMAHRREMIQNIVQLLKQRDKNANPEWVNKLPQMVKQLEVSLYRSAPSFEAYADKKTLKQRLQNLAMDIAKKTEKEPGPGPGSGGPISGPPPPSQPPQSSLTSQQGSDEWKIRIKHKQQRLLLLHHSSKCTVEGPCPMTAHCAEMKKLWVHMRTCTNSHCKVPHCFSSRSILSHYRKCKDPKCPACGPVRRTVREPSSFSLTMPQQPQPRAPPNRQARMPHQEPLYPPICPPVSNPQPPPPEQSSDSSTDPRIKQKQQRLLLLRHASKCTAEEGKCTKTPYCASMKKLWKHISDCQDHTCKVPHCLSSRCVLMHYRKCKDPKCPTCAPVRGSITDPRDRSPPAKKARTTPPIPGGKRPDAPPSSAQRPSRNNEIPPPKAEEDNVNSLISCFTTQQIRLHIDSLNRTFKLLPKDLKERCMASLKVLQEHKHGWVFNSPVDPVELDLPDYFDRIKKPMDLGTIYKKVESGSYHTIDDFSNDVKLTFNNAMQYNENGSVVYTMAKEMMDKFNEDYGKLRDQLIQEEEMRRKNSKVCGLCGIEKLHFEPAVYFCIGNCATKRIHRNRNYYVGGNNQYHWCNQCYNELDDDKIIEFADISMKKEDLLKKKNDEVTEENWVQCDTCDNWFHQICGLFNSRLNKDNKYSCPKCLLKERESGRVEIKPMIPCAKDLPRTKLSEWLENSVTHKVRARVQSLAKEKAETDRISFEEAFENVYGGGNITIRQVTATDRKLEVKDRMKKRYAKSNYPEEFPYRCKCIVAFQNLDGVDVILFALYLYEHGEDNHAPNKRTVYISYLDSVHFMRPRKLRTFVYHEILIAYLDYARQRGFETAHIWACPPLKGDDYIFYAKPEDQKTPKDSRLRQWYIDMLIESQKRDIVGKVTNMYDLYFKPGIYDATSVPYLEGDYFSGEIENTIKNIEEGKGSKSNGGSKKSKKKKGGKDDKSKKNKSKVGRNGTRSGSVNEITTGNDDHEFAIEPVDPVMEQLGEAIKNMKDSFIVLFLNCANADPRNLEIPRDIEEQRNEWKEQNSRQVVKRSADGNLKTPNFDSFTGKGLRNKFGEPIKVIDDDTENIDSEILDNRQLFLDLCKRNYYQFDDLRRAKHTSMMVLWHLNNRHAAKFVPTCNCCSKEIFSGVRYNCPTCKFYDLCPDCYRNPNTNRGLCTHKLIAKAVENTEDNKSGGGQSQGTIDREKQIKLHIQLLEHASLCKSSKCPSPNCLKMKGYLKHFKECPNRSSGNCRICKRVLTLLRYHAQNCKKKICPIPHCGAIRERIRKLQKQQEAMDDRRRQVMNMQYRMGVTSG